jgi:hypothetical protein
MKSISLYQYRVRSTELLKSPLDYRKYDLTFGIGDIDSPLICESAQLTETLQNRKK